MPPNVCGNILFLSALRVENIASVHWDLLLPNKSDKEITLSFEFGIWRVYQI